MKIIEDTSPRPVIRESPVFLPGMVLCCVVMAFWLLATDFRDADGGERILLLGLAPGLSSIAYFVCSWVTATFDRELGVVEVQRRRLFEGRVDSYPLAEFVRARRDRSHDDEGDTYRLVFTNTYVNGMDEKTRTRLPEERLNEVPLTRSFSGIGDLSPIVTRINAWHAQA